MTDSLKLGKAHFMSTPAGLRSLKQKQRREEGGEHDCDQANHQVVIEVGSVVLSGSAGSFLDGLHLFR